MATAAFMWYQITLSQNKMFLLERMQQIIAGLSGQDDAVLSTRREHCGKKKIIYIYINITQQSGIFYNNSLVRPIKLDMG